MEILGEKSNRERKEGGEGNLRYDGERRLSNEAQARTRVLHSSRVVAAEDCEGTPRTAPPSLPASPPPSPVPTIPSRQTWRLQ